MEAAGRDLEGFKGFEGLKPGKRQACMPSQQRAMCRQRAGCNPGTAKADGKRAWWKLPPANNRRLCAGKGHANCRQRAWCNAGPAKADGQRAWWQLLRGILEGFKGLKGFKRLKPGRLQPWNSKS